MNLHEGPPQPNRAAGAPSRVHFGDLHITDEREQNYQDLLALIADANAHPSGPDGVWREPWDSSRCADGTHRLTVRVESSGGVAVDTINVLTDQAGIHEPPVRQPRDLDNTVGAYPEKGILGTQPGPNKNGAPR